MSSRFHASCACRRARCRSALSARSAPPPSPAPSRAPRRPRAATTPPATARSARQATRARRRRPPPSPRSLSRRARRLRRRSAKTGGEPREVNPPVTTTSPPRSRCCTSGSTSRRIWTGQEEEADDDDEGALPPPARPEPALAVLRLAAATAGGRIPLLKKLHRAVKGADQYWKELSRRQDIAPSHVVNDWAGGSGEPLHGWADDELARAKRDAAFDVYGGNRVGVVRDPPGGAAAATIVHPRDGAPLTAPWRARRRRPRRLGAAGGRPVLQVAVGPPTAAGGASIVAARSTYWVHFGAARASELTPVRVASLGARPLHVAMHLTEPAEAACLLDDGSLHILAPDPDRAPQPARRRLRRRRYHRRALPRDMRSTRARCTWPPRTAASSSPICATAAAAGCSLTCARRARITRRAGARRRGRAGECDRPICSRRSPCRRAARRASSTGPACTTAAGRASRSRLGSTSG